MCYNISIEVKKIKEKGKKKVIIKGGRNNGKKHEL